MFPLLHLTLLILSVNLIQPTAEPTAEVSVLLPLVEAGNNGEPANRFPLNLVLTIVFYLLSNTPLAFLLVNFFRIVLGWPSGTVYVETTGCMSTYTGIRGIYRLNKFRLMLLRFS